MISQIELLTESECLEIRSRVLQLRPHWTARSLIYPFFTLGAASYLDATPPGSFSIYCRMAERSNQFLRSNFEELYSRLEKTLESFLGSPAKIHSQYALPGFHVFFAHPEFQNPFASVHCDLQYELLSWEQTEEIQWDKPVSFTLAISLPQSGAGMNVWDVRHKELLGLTKPQEDSLINSRQSTFVSYKLGSLVLHSGLNVHQIAAMPDSKPGEERITFQGHALSCNGVWRIYW